MSRRLALLNALGRGLFRPTVARASDPVRLRHEFDRFARLLFCAPPHSLILPHEISPQQTGLLVSNRPGAHPPRRGKVILYFHGGAFMAGSPRTHAAMLARIARFTRTEVIAPAYRLAPEHVFPAAVEDARAAYDALRARGYAPTDIVIGGDSAGGNLALGLLARLCGEGQPPAGVFAFSPVTDLTFSGRSIAENAARDSMLPAWRRADFLRFYLDGADPADPRASPLLADFPAPPPVFLQVSASEILYDDTRHMADKLRAAGGHVTLDAWDDAPHVWVIFDRLVPEAREGLRRAAGFVNGLFDGAQATAETDGAGTPENAPASR